MSIEFGLVIVGILLLGSVIASSASSRLGIPTLVLFIAVGMLAGSEGPGGIIFDNASVARGIGMVALALILFSGGLDTPLRAVTPVIRAGVSLATVGTFTTAGLVGLFAHWALGLNVLEGMLLGAIIASTDAAAVFGVLRAKGIRLKHRIAPLLELESGSNDPTAVFLTVSIVSLIHGNAESVSWLIADFFIEMTLGLAIGIVGGLACAWLINKLRVEFEGLYPAFTIGTAFLTFGGAHFIGANGFLAVYVAGVTLGSRKFAHRVSLMQFHDAFSWLMQIAMFIGLGLLVFPSQLPMVALPALLIALFLALVARPFAVFLSLAASSRFQLRDKLFISWAGLRGAVPVILATIPLTEKLPHANLIFNVVFFVVLVSIIIQGSTLTAVARLLKVAMLGEEIISERRIASQMMEVTIPVGSPASGRQLVDLQFPETALLIRLTREKASYVPRGSTVFEEGDKILVSCSSHDKKELLKVFSPQ